LDTCIQGCATAGWSGSFFSSHVIAGGHLRDRTVVAGVYALYLTTTNDATHAIRHGLQFVRA